jgi:hypothetical protein
MFAEKEEAFVVEGQPVGSRLATIIPTSGVTGRLQKNGNAIFKAPLKNGVFRDVREKKAIVGFVPNRALRPSETGSNDFNFGPGSNQLIEGGIEPFDRPCRGKGRLLSARDGADKCCDDKFFHRRLLSIDSGFVQNSLTDIS